MRSELDYLGAIKLINYIRRECREGRAKQLNLSTASIFQDDKYLQPVIEDDPLLYSLEEVFGEDFENFEGDPQASGDHMRGAEDDGANKTAELQQALQKTQKDLQFAEQKLDLALQALEAQKTRWDELDTPTTSPTRTTGTKEPYQGNYDGHSGFDFETSHCLTDITGRSSSEHAVRPLSHRKLP